MPILLRFFLMCHPFLFLLISNGRMILFRLLHRVLLLSSLLDPSIKEKKEKGISQSQERSVEGMSSTPG